MRDPRTSRRESAISTIGVSFRRAPVLSRIAAQIYDVWLCQGPVRYSYWSRPSLRSATEPRAVAGRDLRSVRRVRRGRERVIAGAVNARVLIGQITKGVCTIVEAAAAVSGLFSEAAASCR